jgi:hypothetical protein
MPAAIITRSETSPERKPTPPPPLAPDKRRTGVLAAGIITVLIAFSAGVRVAGLALVILLAAAAGRSAARRWPQAIGSLLSFLVTAAAGVFMTGVFGPWLSVSGSPDLGVTFLLVTLTLTLAVWAAPLRGVHRGWTTLLVLAPMWFTVPAIIRWPGHSALIALGAGLLGLGVLVWQARYRFRGQRSRGPRRVVKIALVAVTGAVGLVSAGSAAPGVANAWPLEGAFNSFKDSFVCSIASPNTSPQLAGTGPEGLIGNYNFVGLPAKDTGDDPSGLDDQGIPVNMDRELDFGDKKTLSDYTLYELSGLRGIKFINWSHGAGGDGDCSIMSWVSVTSGNMINMASNFLLQLAIFLKEYSAIKNPVASFFEPVTPVVDALLAVLFSFMGCLIIAMLIWGIFAARRQGLSVVLNKFGSALAAIVIAVTMYGVVAARSNPDDNGFFMFTNALDEVSGSVSSGVSEMILGRLTDDGTSMCVNPDGEQGVARAQRFSSCLLAEALAYKPWAKATFGTDGARPIEPGQTPMGVEELIGETPGGAHDDAADDAKAEGDGGDTSEDGGPKTSESPLPCYNNYQNCTDLRSYLIAQEGGPTILDQMEKCYDKAGFEGDGEPDIDQSRACNPYFSVAEDLFHRVDPDRGTDEDRAKGNRMLSAYRGDGTFSHAQNAFTGLIGVIVVGTALGILSAAVIWKHVELLILYMLGPGYLMAGALKNDLRGSLDWLKKIAGTFISLTVYSVIASTAVFFVALISLQDVGLIQQLLMMAMVMFGFFKAFSMANQKVDAATGTGQAPGMDRGINKVQNMMGPAIASGVTSRIMSHRGSGQKGMARRAAGSAARGVGTAGKGAAKVTARGAKKAGKWTANNTRGVQMAAGRAVGHAQGAAAYAGHRVSAAVSESDLATKARGVGQKMKDSRAASAANGVKTGAAAAGGWMAGKGHSAAAWVKGDPDNFDDGQSAFGTGRSAGKRVQATAATERTTSQGSVKPSAAHRAAAEKEDKAMRTRNEARKAERKKEEKAQENKAKRAEKARRERVKAGEEAPNEADFAELKRREAKAREEDREATAKENREAAHRAAMKKKEERRRKKEQRKNR